FSMGFSAGATWLRLRGSNPFREVEPMDLRVVPPVHGKSRMKAHVGDTADPARFGAEGFILGAFDQEHRPGLPFGSHTHERDARMVRFSGEPALDPFREDGT